jgi:hypothetical protein
MSTAPAWEVRVALGRFDLSINAGRNPWTTQHLTCLHGLTLSLKNERMRIPGRGYKRERFTYVGNAALPPDTGVNP